jgi:mono/diheme cytochrome c family protein
MTSLTIRRKVSLAGGALLLAGVLWVGCAATQLGATPADLDRARGQADQGANLFATECGTCHGQRGEGVAAAPALLGPGGLPEYPRSTGSMTDPTLIDPQQLQIQQQSRPAGAGSRDTFRNAQDLYTFISKQMPKSRPGSLKPVDYWALVNFMLAVQGTTLPPGGIGPANAVSIPIPKR